VSDPGDLEGEDLADASSHSPPHLPHNEEAGSGNKQVSGPWLSQSSSEPHLSPSSSPGRASSSGRRAVPCPTMVCEREKDMMHVAKQCRKTRLCVCRCCVVGVVVGAYCVGGSNSVFRSRRLASAHGGSKEESTSLGNNCQYICQNQHICFVIIHHQPPLYNITSLLVTTYCPFCAPRLFFVSARTNKRHHHHREYLLVHTTLVSLSTPHERLLPQRFRPSSHGLHTTPCS